MTQVSSANNIGSDTEFILRGRSFIYIINNRTKLRIHNITAKAALKFGSEAWVLKKRE